DVMVTEVEKRSFDTLKVLENPYLNTVNRHLGFTGNLEEIWIQGNTSQRFRLITLIGAVERALLPKNTSSADWWPDGKRVVYYTFDRGTGDPMFVADYDGHDVSNEKKIFEDPGKHNHFPTWSPDGRWIYFVNGSDPDSNMDLWRI